MQILKRILIISLVAATCVVTASASTVNYTYDDLGRLKTVDYGGGKIVTYDYDAAGNRTLHKVEGPGLTSDPNAGGGVIVLPISGFIIIPLPGSVVGN